jgi:hypothetical protein
LQNQRFEHRQQIKQNQQVIFIKLRSTPEFDLMPPMDANLLIVIVRTIRSIAPEVSEKSEIDSNLTCFRPLADVQLGYSSI